MSSSIPAPPSAETMNKGGRGEDRSMGSDESRALIRQHRSAAIDTWGGGDCGPVLRDEGNGTASPGAAATVPALTNTSDPRRPAIAAIGVTGSEPDCACGGAWDCPICAAVASIDDDAPAGGPAWRMGVLVTPF